jgi:hypothetical protein
MFSNSPDDKANDTGEVVSLWGTCGEFSLPGSLWVALLNLAQLYGWMPAGTAPPGPSAVELASILDLPLESGCLGRDGSYYPSHCQVMTRDDAQSFARGLERALLDIPEAVESAQDLLFAGWHGTPTQSSLSILQRLGPAKSSLRDLIIHSRECSELWIC